MSKWRYNFVFILVVLVAALEVGRLFYLQVLKSDLYRALARGQQEIVRQITGQRGNIFVKDRDNLITLATNKDSSICFVNPQIIKDKEEASKELGKVLNIDVKSIFQEINNTNRKFVVLKRKLSADESSKIKKLNIKTFL